MPATSAPASRLTVGAIKETVPGENRVSLTPDTVKRLNEARIDVLIEVGAGAAARFTDADYIAAGAAVVARDDLFARADVVLTVRTFSADQARRLRAGQAAIGMFQPLTAGALVAQFAEQGATMISLDGLTRTISRAQAMDALASQANVAGYKAVLVAADAYPRFFPLLITAAGTAKPADVLVLGAGVAGLQAMGTAHRLGAVVTGYDVRPETRAEIESVSARFLELESVTTASGEGGYARALSADEQAAQQAELTRHIAHFDVVITTAQVPGRRPPVLVTADAVAAMRAGSVLVDLGASSLGGNVEGSVPDETIVTANGVTIIGAGNLPARVPNAASVNFSHNVAALLRHIVHDGALVIDTSDEIQAGVVVTSNGAVVHAAVRAAGAPTPVLVGAA
ncbi:MAG: NAD(P) transhydrogenase subunit alpha [Candidatus Dormibacteraeota bacterium]|nr:NAD(P) transhydrogenase subunit alpha [Candidatus Dormibacteraeota bacterium]